MLKENLIGLNIKYLREQKKLSKIKLAEGIGGKSSQQVGKYESGNSLPPLDVIYQIADFFDVDPGNLIAKDLTIGEAHTRTDKEDKCTTDLKPVIEALRTEQERYKKLVKQIKENNPELYSKITG